MIAPSMFYGHGEVFLCKSWALKQWKHTKKFCKKHKKAIIIGAAVVVAAAIVIVAVVVAPGVSPTAVAGAFGAAGAASSSDKSDDKELEEMASSPSSDASPLVVVEDSPTLKTIIDDQIVSFKENIVEKRFFSPIEFSDRTQGPSWEEDGRTLGSLFAHDPKNGS